MNLLPSLNDERLPTASFDMLQDTFLEFSGWTHPCALTHVHSPMCTHLPATFCATCQFTVQTIGFGLTAQ